MRFFLFILSFILFYTCNEPSVYFKNDFFENKHNILYFRNSPFSGLMIDTLNFEYIKKTNYEDGLKNGTAVSFYKNLDTASLRYYKKGVKVGIHKGWWPNKKEKFLYYFNSNGEYDGEIKQWHFNGIPFKILNYKNGREFGYQKIWNDRGVLKANYFIDENSERFGLIGIKKCYSTSINQ